jgi:hypothetical protein
MTLVFGYVTIAYLWGWTGTAVSNWHLLVLLGFQESWLGEIALAVAHLGFYLVGVGEAIVFYAFVRPILLRRPAG